MESFKDIIQKGTTQDVLNFCKEKNILNPKIFKFEDIYWLLQD